MLLPVRDGAQFLDAAIDSIRAQRLADFELLLLDDGSTDDSPAIIRRHAAADARLIPLPGPRSASPARSIAASTPRGLG